ncbi:MAG TPA: tetratricopeptide repeat protein [Pirellulales bacterium]|nr:tetratricopeptide repeat protein [Pirellulales bacterium]
MAGTDDELADAWQAYHAGDLGTAEVACQRLLAADGDHVGATFLAGLIDYQRGRFAPAVDRLRKVVQLRPDYAEAHNNLGNALAVQGQLSKAEHSFREALRHKPQYADAFNNLANTLRDQGKLEESLGAYRRALELHPDYAECHNTAGIALSRLKRFQEATDCYRRALELRPTFAEPHNNLGIVLASQGRPEEAVAEFRQALGLRPDYADALANMGKALLGQGKLDEAIEAYQRAVEVSPGTARAHNSLGTALAKCGKLDQAVASFRRAVELQADYAEAHNNLGNALRELGELDEAESHLRQALTLKPGYPEAHNNLGIVHLRRRNVAAAIGEYEQALRLNPDYSEAHLNRALAWLGTRDFRRGWAEYEWRWRSPGFRELSCAAPKWDGGLLDGKTILLWAEQGLGDTLQFVRYARLVRQREGRVWLRAPRSLHALLGRTPGVERLFGEEEELPSFDCHAPLVSLPRLFATTLDDIPSDQPYLFADERLVEQWRSKLDELADSLKVGIGWQGNPRFGADRDRSLPVAKFLPLTQINGVRLVSLQKGPGVDQLDALSDRSAVYAPSGDIDGANGAFMDTAAIMAGLDLVITSDSALAHLAGGLGVPAWLVLPFAADWRWLGDRDDSPWYPTMLLFRQASPGDWDGVFEKVADELREVVESRQPDHAIIKHPAGARAWNARGVMLAERGGLDEAITLFRQALRYSPEFAEAHNNLGNALRQRGDHDTAAEHLRRALVLQPQYAEAHHNLGIVFASQRQHEKAIESFRVVIELKPDFAAAWNSLGLAHVALRSYAESEACFRRALEIDPRSTRVLNNLGNALSDQGKRAEAVPCFERALELDPNYIDALNNLGNSLRELGRRDEAIASFERALAIRPEFAEAHNNLGITWSSKGDHERAVACYREALRLSPDYAAAHNNLGIALGSQGKHGESVESYRRALEIKPDYAEAHNNLGIVLSQQGEYEEAISRYRRAIELKPDYAEAYSNMGITFTELGRLEESLESYNEALRLKEDYPDAYMNRALAFLVKGDFERGWREYEWRWKCKDFNPRKFGKPRWEGEPLDGRRIMLHAEQGFGDTFQFVRYARLVKEERGGTVIVWCPKPLIPLLRHCPYIDQLTVEGDALPEFDVHLPLLSLPKIFETTLEMVLRETPYLFAKPELIERWREEFGYIDAFKIGINWQGNPKYRGDRHRSIPLDKFAPLARLPGVRLISLQKGLGTEQIAQATERFSLTELPDHRDGATGSFMDTAAILMNLDLVISSDTSLVHLAGGMGVPVWVALPRAADWRWLLNREDCPWYPTMRLFRQREWGNWEELFDHMAGEVWELVKQKQRQRPATLSAGELLDRIAALECQLQLGGNGHAPVELEYKLGQLREVCRERVPESDELDRLRAELQAINEKLRQCESEAQECEAADDSSPRFSELLKSLRRLHMERAAIKQAIDEAADREREAVSYAALSQRFRERDQKAENENQTLHCPPDAIENAAQPAGGRVNANGSAKEHLPSGDASDPFAVFDRIYRKGGWNGKGSGLGSSPDASKGYLALVNRLINQTPDIRSILDIGCGDWQIMREVDLSRKQYLGVDVAASVVDANVREFGKENIHFQVLNPYTDEIPDTDLVIMKDVAQHLPTACVQRILGRIATRCRYALIANDFTEHNLAPDIPIGGWRPVNVLAPPYNLPGATLGVWNGKHVTLSTFAR